MHTAYRPIGDDLRDMPVIAAGGGLLDIIGSVRDSGAAVAITKDGVPEAVILPYEKFDALLETMAVLADRHLMAQIEESKKDIEQGRLVELDEAF